MQKPIQEDKDVDFRFLLIEEFELNTKSISDQNKPDKRIACPGTIFEFITAFRNYKSCMFEAFPQFQCGLDLYEGIIIWLSNQFPSITVFYDYHKIYSFRAAEVY